MVPSRFNLWANPVCTIFLLSALTGCAGSGGIFPLARIEAEAVGRPAPSGPEQSEASGGNVVHLRRAGEYLEFPAPVAADALTIRFSLPDSPRGGGRDGLLDLSVNGSATRAVLVTSRLSRVYGDFPWTNDPARGNPRHFFDEASVRVPGLRAGDVIRLSLPPSAPPCVIDFVEFENVPPPLPRPRGSLSLCDFGAVPDDGRDDAPALLAALREAESTRRTLWIPPGFFHLNGDRIRIGRVCVRGAGMWHSVFTGKQPMFEGTGCRIDIRDLAIRGMVDARDDSAPDNAFNGNFGTGSVLHRLWIEHLKCGVWTLHGTRRMRIDECRIRNTMADGVNFCDGTRDSIVTRCHLRNTGDDALATWSPTGAWSSRVPCRNNRFIDNRIELPWLANGIGLYGGSDHTVSRNRVTGTTLSGGGLLISSGHGAAPFTGTLHITNNIFDNTGGPCYIGENVGSVWIHAAESPITARILLRNNTLISPKDAGLSLHGPQTISRLVIDRLTVQNRHAPAVRIARNASGSASLHSLAAPGPAPAILNESHNFEIR